MSFDKNDSGNLAAIRPERHRNGALSMHPYFGKVDPSIARTIILQFSEPGGIVLDPFCGSGTVLHEALLSQRSAIGWDSSPLAVLLATAKLLGIDKDDRRELDSLAEQLAPYGEKAGMFREALPLERDIPLMPRVLDMSTWFAQNAVAELGFLRSYLVRATAKVSPRVRIFIRTAFSRIIIAASNQQGESSYRRIDKADYPGRVVQLLIEALRTVADTAGRFGSLMQESLGGHDTGELVEQEGMSRILWEPLYVDIHLRDTRSVSIGDDVRSEAVDLVVTSPPYLMSWDYGLYHKFRFYWLGFDLDKYENTEIGRHLRRKGDDVSRYQQDMLNAFRHVSTVLKPGGHVAIVNAPSVVYGVEVDTNQILAECGREVGWYLLQIVTSLDIPGPHHGMYASLETRGANAPGKSGKREHVLIFESCHP